MGKGVKIFAVVLLLQQCLSQPLEETVVSVYTTHSTTMGTSPPLDVYHQIASNLAERITSPIYRFLGINATKPETTTKSWRKVELLDEHDINNKNEIKPIDNNISTRDVEELSVEGLKKTDTKKPEKITLYSSYLPVLTKASQFIGINRSNADRRNATTNDVNNETSNANNVKNETSNVVNNDTSNELDDPFEWDEVETVKPREGQLVYILEFFGSLLQLLWGGVTALFSSSGNTGSS